MSGSMTGSGATDSTTEVADIQNPPTALDDPLQISSCNLGVKLSPFLDAVNSSIADKHRSCVVTRRASSRLGLVYFQGI